MTGPDNALTAALADADRQIAHVDATINDLLMPDVQRTLDQYGDPSMAWAVMSTKLRQQLSDRPAFLADMLARVIVKQVSEA